MFAAFFAYILIFSVISIGEFGTTLHYKNITCYNDDSNTTNNSDFNFTNLTEILNEDEKFFGVIDANIISPNNWLLFSGIIGFILVLLMMFVFTLKNKGNDEGAISKILLFLSVMFILANVALFVYSLVIWTFTKKNCTDAIFDLPFKNVLYITHATSIVNIFYTPCLLSVPQNEKIKKMHEIEKENETQNNTKEMTKKEIDDML